MLEGLLSLAKYRVTLDSLVHMCHISVCGHGPTLRWSLHTAFLCGMLGCLYKNPVQEHQTTSPLEHQVIKLCWELSCLQDVRISYLWCSKRQNFFFFLLLLLLWKISANYRLRLCRTYSWCSLAEARKGSPHVLHQLPHDTHWLVTSFQAEDGSSVLLPSQSQPLTA